MFWFPICGKVKENKELVSFNLEYITFAWVMANKKEIQVWLSLAKDF